MNRKSTRETLGELIRRQREIGKLSMRQLSQMVGISNPYLSQIENGLRAPSEKVLRGIANSLGVPFESLKPAEEAESAARTRQAIRDDQLLTASQKQALLITYEAMVSDRNSFVSESDFSDSGAAETDSSGSDSVEIPGEVR